jgi:hypothetical protein
MFERKGYLEIDLTKSTTVAIDDEDALMEIAVRLSLLES